jgi:acetyltransferase-like isoleucine patch superfamily enzyme
MIAGARRLARAFRGWAFGRYLSGKGAVLGGTQTAQGPWPRILNRGTLVIGDGCRFNCFRLRQHIVVEEGATLVLGAHSYINDGVNICARLSVVIGAHTRIGDMTYIYDTNFHETSPGSGVGEAPVEIGRNVWIGANSMVLAGASIGDHSVIGGGSVVSGRIGAKSVAVGSPARIVSEMDVPDGWVRK